MKSFLDKLMGRRKTSADAFQTYRYQRHNMRRLEHLAGLGLPLRDSTVLEVGAGIGDHTGFFLDRGCRVVSTEARTENLNVLRARYPDLRVRPLDLDQIDPTFTETFDIVYCYGLLYHLKDPAGAIDFMAARARRLLLLETCVSYGDAELLNPCTENISRATQSFTGIGCRPTRRYIYNHLQRHFEFVYLPTTQPNHDEFPIDWTVTPPDGALTRAIFVASRQPLQNSLLTEEIPQHQRRH